MHSIALLVPVCSRNQNYQTIEDIPFLKYLWPSFLKTYNPTHNYTFYIGIDNSDEFYMENYKKIYNCLENLSNYENIRIYYVILIDCEHKPAKAWNKLFEVAYRGTDYFYQIGDDIVMLDLWVDRFIEILSARENIGVVGPCNQINYNQRWGAGKPAVIENAFVSQKHYLTFGTFFNREIDNWYCDDWITEVYKPNYSTYCIDIKVENKIVDNRYNIKPIEDKIRELIENDKKLLLNL